MLALLSLLAALAPDPLPPPPPAPPPAASPVPRAIVLRVDARLSGLEARLRGDVPPSRLRELARTLVERARLRLGAGDPAAADQLGAAAFDTLRADRPLLIVLPAPPHGPDWLPAPPLPPAGGPGAGPVIRFVIPLSPADRAAQRLDTTAMLVATSARFAERGDAATLMGLARAALGDARRALAADDPAGAERGSRRAESLARAALHVAIADDPALRFPFVPAPPPRHPPPLPLPGEGP